MKSWNSLSQYAISIVTNSPKSDGKKGLDLNLPLGESAFHPPQANFKTNLLNTMEIFSPSHWNSRHWLRIELNYRTGCFYLKENFYICSEMLSFPDRNRGLSSLHAFIKKSNSTKKHFPRKSPTIHLFYIMTCMVENL